MSDYKKIDLKDIVLKHFINIENGSKLISLSIFNGKDFYEAQLTPVQAREISKELINRAELIEVNNGKIFNNFNKLWLL